MPYLLWSLLVRFAFRIPRPVGMSGTRKTYLEENQIREYLNKLDRQ